MMPGLWPSAAFDPAMIAWYSLLLVFIVPAADLGQRLLGAPPALALAGDVALVMLGVVLPYRCGWRAGGTRDVLPGLAACAVLAIAIYALCLSAFRFSPYGENIFDLHYIASLMQAADMPASDIWVPGGDVAHYYYLGFYCVAFYSGLLGLDIGQSYALWLLIVPVVVFANYWSAIRGGVAYRALAAFTATFPATGLSVLVASGVVDIGDHVRGMAHVRLPEWVNLAPPDGYLVSVISGYAYPIEGLAHLLGWLGDLHPPVYTFVLLSIVIAALCHTDDARFRIAAPGIAACAVPLSYAINPWTLPCFAFVCAYALVRGRALRESIVALLAVAGMTLVLMPFFIQQDLKAGTVSLAWLPGDQRSSLALLMTVWGPLLLASAAVYAAGARTLFPLLFVAMVLGLELLLMDDPYSDQYERFNGVLKIGSFAMAGWTAAVLIEAGRSPRRWLRPIALLPLLAVCLLQLVDALAPSWQRPWRERNWALEPVAMLQRSDHRALFLSLEGRCSGLVLERLHGTAYSDGPLVSTLLGWPTYAGWPSHMALLGAMDEIERRRAETMQAWFDEPQVDLLRTWDVRYVLIDASLGWNDEQLSAAVETLAPYYRFEPLHAGEDSAVVGYFVSADDCATPTVVPG